MNKQTSQYPQLAQFIKNKTVLTGLRMLAIMLLYLLVARASLHFVVQPEGIASTWPPSGLALALLLLDRQRAWKQTMPAIFVANFLANLLGNNLILTSLAFAAANCLETALLAYILWRFLPGRLNFERVETILYFFVITIIGITLTALVGAAIPALAFGANYWQVWLTWWIADSLGTLWITPLIMSKVERTKLTWPLLVEGLLLASAILLTAFFLFLTPQPGSVLRTYILFPFFIWAVLRFDQRYLTMMLLLVGSIAVLGTSYGLGQFADPLLSGSGRILTVQVYLGILISTMLLSSAMLFERKLAEDAIIRLAAIVESSNEAIIGKNLDGVIISWNSGAEHMYGYTASEAIGQSISMLLPPDKPEYLERILQKIKDGDLVQHYETTRKTKNGHVLDVLLSISPVKNSADENVGVATISHDISERKQIEAALSKSEELHRMLFNTILDAAFLTAPDGSVIMVNPAASQIFGWTSEEICHGGLSLLCDQKDPEFISALEKLNQNGQFQGVLPFISKDRSRISGEVSWVNYSDKDGQPRSSITVRDISEQRRTEKIINARSKILEFSQDHSMDELLSATLDQAEALTGSQIGFYHFLEEDQTTLSLQNWSTRTLREFCTAIGKGTHYPVDQAGIWADCVRQRKPIIHNDYASLDYRRGLPEGHAAVIREMVVPIMRGNDIVCILGVGNKGSDYTQRDVEILSQLGDLSWDITIRKRVEEKLIAAHAELEQRVWERTTDLQTANLMLEKALRSRDEFLAAMSHELRTPLTGVLGLAQVLQLQTYGPLSEKQIKALKNIESSGQHLLELINHILDYSKLQSNSLTLDRVPCSLREICQTALEKAGTYAILKNQHTSFSITPEDILVMADETRLQQILMHLLTNASKFTPAGGSIGIEVQGQSDEQEVCICVWDTGIGIRPEDFPRLFHPFVQLDASLARIYNGTGLGLALVKSLTDLHGGRVNVESLPAQGSRFYVVLPWTKQFSANK